jgi:crossover junction endodeoxyribonuclease RusA
MMVLTLPYPPSVNHAYGQRGGRRFIKPAGVAFRKTVAVIVSQATAFRSGPIFQHGDLALRAVLNPPVDGNDYDFDNWAKATADAITHTKRIWTDDNQVKVALTVMSERIVSPGAITLTIAPLADIETMWRNTV